MAPTTLVVMGVSGAGKSTVALRLADSLGWPMAEADQLHPPANIAKMAGGEPLDDTDRMPWLRLVRQWITDRAQAGVSAVVACSALKRPYRDLLRQAPGRVCFLCLHGGAGLIEDRLLLRTGHFMPASLLGSQLKDFQPLSDDEDGITVDPRSGPAAIAEDAISRLGLR